MADSSVMGGPGGAGNDFTGGGGTSPVADDGSRRGRRQRQSDNAATILSGLWIISGAMVGGLAAFSVVVVVVPFENDEANSVSLMVVAVVFVAAAAIQLAFARFERPLDCSTPEALAGSYRTRLVLRLALAQIAGLFGVAVYVTGVPWWTLALGLLISGLGFLRAAPTNGSIEADQQRLQARGCPHLLSEALRLPAQTGLG